MKPCERVGPEGFRQGNGMTIEENDVQRIARHPCGRFVVRLCGALAKLPGMPHQRVDRLQGMLLSPAFRDITKALTRVFTSFVPGIGQAEALHSLGQAIKRHGPNSGPRSYQRTLREWLNEQE